MGVRLTQNMKMNETIIQGEALLYNLLVMILKYSRFLWRFSGFVLPINGDIALYAVSFVYLSYSLIPGVKEFNFLAWKVMLMFQLQNAMLYLRFDEFVYHCCYSKFLYNIDENI